MRWQPDSPVCAECGFDWQLAHQDAIDLVAQTPDAAAAALARIGDPAQRGGDRWSASMYLWHLVDGLRIGTERQLTLSCDPACGLPCWDENALAQARRYQQLSPAVGLIVLRSAAQEWVTAAAPHRLTFRSVTPGSASSERLTSSAAAPMRSATT